MHPMQIVSIPSFRIDSSEVEQVDSVVTITPLISKIAIIPSL
jgi:hypothetical protein